MKDKDVLVIVFENGEHIEIEFDIRDNEFNFVCENIERSYYKGYEQLLTKNFSLFIPKKYNRKIEERDGLYNDGNTEYQKVFDRLTSFNDIVAIEFTDEKNGERVEIVPVWPETTADLCDNPCQNTNIDKNGNLVIKIKY